MELAVAPVVLEAMARAQVVSPPLAVRRVQADSLEQVVSLPLVALVALVALVVLAEPEVAM